MASQYAYDSEGIYRCRRCKEQYAVGHSLICRGKKSKAEKEEDKKTNKTKADEKFATDITEGFKLLDR